MTRSRSLTPLSDDDFGSIEAAVMETARGRWFLAEYARRNRTADTEVLLAAIERLERAVAGERSTQDMDRIHFDLLEMAKAIARTKAEIAAIRPEGEAQSRFEEATEELDGIVRTTERATSEILDAAEHIQEAAWTLRERGFEEALCDALDKRATDIYLACAFQDLTAQRTTKVVQVLRYLEGRINAMIDIWREPSTVRNDPPPAAPAVFRSGLSQTDVDDVIVAGDEPVEPAAECNPSESEPAPDAPRPSLRQQIRHEALAALDALDTREKLRRFT